MTVKKRVVASFKFSNEIKDANGVLSTLAQIKRNINLGSTSLILVDVIAMPSADVTYTYAPACGTAVAEKMKAL